MRVFLTGANGWVGSAVARDLVQAGHLVVGLVRSSEKGKALAANGGTPVLNLWLRAMGAKIGHGVWCETYWLPEADLIRLGDGACVNSGCVVQTHLFHDRILAMDTVTLGAGATLGEWAALSAIETPALGQTPALVSTPALAPAPAF